MTSQRVGLVCICLGLSAAAPTSGQDGKGRAAVREVLSLEHDLGVSHVAISPDGKRILGVCQSFPMVVTGHIKVWDANTGKLLLTLKHDKKGAVHAAAFSPDSKRVVGACGDNSRTSVRAWDAETGKVVAESVYLDHPRTVTLPILSPDTKRLFSHADVTGRLDLYGVVSVWDAATGKKLHSIKAHDKELYGQAVSADGKLLATASMDRTVKLWDLDTGKEVRSLKCHAGTVGRPVAFSHNGRRVVSCGRVGDELRSEVKVWDVETGKLVFDLDMKGMDLCICVAFSPDCKLLAAGDQKGAVKIWDAETGKDVVAFNSHKNLVFSIAFSPNGMRIVTGADNTSVKVWELKR